MAEKFNADDNYIELLDENDESVMFEFIHALNYQEVDYVVLAPVEEDPDEEETGVVILRAVIGDEEDSYEAVDDEELLNKLFEMFVAEMEEIEDFEAE
jgi:hypothetical protein